MTTPESFNDQELADLLDVEMTRDLRKLTAAEQYAVIHDKLWSAIETLETRTCCGPDPDQFSKEYDDLVDILRAITDADSFAGNRDLLEQHIHMTARKTWDSDTNVLAQIALAIEEQLYPTNQSIDESLIKRTLTAKLTVDGHDMERWLPLIDFTLVGEPLDLSRAEDIGIMMQALENQANADSMPEVQLYHQLLEVFGVMEIDEGNITDAQELQRIDTFSMAARDFTELTYYMPGQAAQPNRHAKIYELTREYKITDGKVIRTIIDLTDAFEETE